MLLHLRACSFFLLSLIPSFPPSLLYSFLTPELPAFLPSQVLRFSQLALDLRSAIAAVAMSQETASQVLDMRRVITVMRMGGSEFEVRLGNWSRVRVTDLKTIVAMQEHIAEDMFDLSVGDVVLKSPEFLNLSLEDAGILGTVPLTMTKTTPTVLSPTS